MKIKVKVKKKLIIMKSKPEEEKESTIEVPAHPRLRCSQYFKHSDTIHLRVKVVRFRYKGKKEIHKKLKLLELCPSCDSDLKSGQWTGFN